MYTFGGKPSGRLAAKPQYIFKPSRILRDNGKLQKCLICFGVPRLVLMAGALTGFQPTGKAYAHLDGCKQKGKF